MSSGLGQIGISHVRATIPLPPADNDGVRFPSSDRKGFERRLVAIGGGFRKHLRVSDRSRDEGRLYKERAAVYVSTIEDRRVSELRVLLEQACARLGQETILLELTRVEKILLSERGRTGIAAREPSR